MHKYIVIYITPTDIYKIYLAYKTLSGCSMVAFEILKGSFSQSSEDRYAQCQCALVDQIFEKHAATSMLLALLPFCRAASQAP